MKVILTGAAGFIGSAMARFFIDKTHAEICVVDALTYAGNLKTLASIEGSRRFRFEHANVCDDDKLESIFEEFQPDMVMHFAAESHVDRSISAAGSFIETNVVGTYKLLEVCRQYYERLSEGRRQTFRFHHISTDEVYGDLPIGAPPFNEDHPYNPSSPYSATKASSDHLVRAWHRTHGLPVLISNCSNNYGPFHFPEKLIPKVITNAIQGLPIPVYGSGFQIRDWLFVEDHVEALQTILLKGAVGTTYLIGGREERRNIDVVETICQILESMRVEKPRGILKFSDLIEMVPDRPGHDGRYAVDSTRITESLGWQPRHNFTTGLQKTIQWFLDNREWWFEFTRQ